MKNLFVLSLIFIGGFLSPNGIANNQTILKDKMIFKVARSVFSLNDLNTYFNEVNNLSCVYEDSLLIKIFKKEFSHDKKKYFLFREGTLTKAHKDYFLSLINFSKLLIYSKSQIIIYFFIIEIFT